MSLHETATVAAHDRLSALYEVSRVLNSSLELEEALVIVIDAAIRLSGAERGFLMLLDEASGQFHFRVARNANRDTLAEDAFEISRSVVQEVIQTGQPVVTLDAQRDPRFTDRASVVNYLLRSIMAVPLRRQGRPIGVLYVDTRTRRALFRQDDLELLRTFADQAATALINAQLFEAQKRDAEVRRVLLEIAQLAQGATAPREFLARLAEQLPIWLQSDRCAFFLREPEADDFTLVAVTRAPDTKLDLAGSPSWLGTLLEPKLHRSRGPLHLTAAEMQSGAPAERQAIRNAADVLAIPVFIAETLAAICLIDNSWTGRPFTPVVLALAEALGAQLATALHRLQLFETAQRQLAELTALNVVAVAATKSASLADLSEKVRTAFKSLLRADGLAVLLVDEDAGVFRLASSPDIPDGHNLAIPLSAGIVGRVAATARPMRVGDVSTVPDYLQLLPTTRSECCVPIKVGERVIGVINAESSVPNAFSASDERLLVTVASQLAIAIDKQRLLETERQQRELAEALRDVGLALAVDADVEVVLDRLLGHIARVVPYRAACALLVENGVARTAGLRGYERLGPGVADRVRALLLDIEHTPNLRRMAETGQPLVIGDVLADPDWRLTESSKYLRAWAGAPVMMHGKCVAYLSVEHEAPNFYQPHHARCLAAFAGHAALALRNVGLFQAAERRAAELEAVRAASLSLTSSLDLPAVLNAILEGTLNLLPGLQSTSIYLYDQGRLEFGAALDNAGRPVTLPQPRPEGLTYSVARSGEAIIVSDTRSHPLFADVSDRWSGAVMGLPLKYGKRVVGVMLISYAGPHQPGEAELRILSLLGEQAAAAIENARLFDAVRLQLEELTLLHSVAVAATESRTSDELIARATDLIGQTLPARFCGVMLLDEAGENLHPHPSCWGLTADMNYSVPLGKGITGRVARTGLPARVDDVRRDPDYLPGHPSVRSKLCVPLRSGDRLIGVIDAESDRLNAFSERDERLLITVAGQLALAFEKVRLLEAERAARRQAETLREVANLANVALDRSTLLERLLELLNQLVPFASASVMLLQDGQLQMVAHRGFRAADQEFQPLLPEDWPTMFTVLRDRRPLIIERTAEHPFWRQVAGAEYIRCWIGAPLLVHDRVIGILNVDGEQPGQFSSADADSVMAFANQAAAALERLSLLEETRRRERELTILLNVARIVSSSLELKSVLTEVAHAVAQTFAVEACSLSIYDPATRALTTSANYAAVAPWRLEQVGSTFALADYPLTARVLENDEVAYVNVADANGDAAEIALLNLLGYRTLLMLAARAGGRAVGLLELYSSAPERHYSAGDFQLLRAIADQVAVAIENGRLFQAEREQRQLAEALHRVAIGLGASLDLSSVLDQLLEQIGQVVPYDMANVMLLDAATGQARVVRHRGYEKFDEQAPHLFETLALDVATVPNLRQMAETGQPHVVPNVQQSAEWQVLIPSIPIRSWAGAPVVSQGRTLAFFNLDKIEPGFYRQAHVERLAAFAGQAALALQNAQLYQAERRRVTALTTLHALSLELSAQLELSELWPRLLSSATRLLAIRAGTLYTCPAGASHLTLTATYGLPMPEPGQAIGMDQGLAGAVAATHQTIVWHDDVRLHDGPEGALSPSPRSALGLPIKLHEQLLSVLVLLDDQPQRFSEADVDILNLFADRAAIAIENVRLLAAVGKEKSRLELLFNLSQSLASTLNPQEVAHRAMALICATTGAIKAVIYAADLESGELQPVQLHGYGDVPSERLAEIRLLRGQGVSGYAAQIRRPVLASDVTQDPHWVHIPFLDDGICAALALPLLAGDELVGVLSLLSDRPHFLPEEQIPLLRAASVPVALALQNARLFETEASQVYHLTLLNEITQAAVTIEALPELVQALAERLGDLAGAVSCYLDLWDEQRQQPVPAAIYGAERATYAAGFVALSEAVLRTGHTLVVEDTYASPYFEPFQADGLPRSAVMALPLLAGDQKLGAALIVYPHPHHFQLRERRHNEQAARQVALAIARARLFHEIRRHADELAVASDLLRTLSATPRVLQDFPAIAANLKQLTQCAYVSMFSLTPDRQRLELMARDQTSLSRGNRQHVPVTADTVPDSLLAGQPLFVPELKASPRLMDGRLGSDGYASCLIWPLRDSEQLTGLLCLLWNEPSGYARVNTHLLGQIADTLALAVQKERLLDETLRRTAELEALTDVSAALRSVDTTPDVLRFLLERTQRVTGAEAVRVVMPAGESGHFIVASQVGLAAGAEPGRPLPDETALEQVMISGTSRLGENARADSVNWPWPDDRPRRAMYAALRLGDFTTGALAIYAPAPRTFTEADLRLLSTIAEVGGNALQRARVLETLEQRVEARTRELAEANERLKELDRLKDQFVSNVSHELRTPLTAIKLHLGLLERRGAELLPRYLPVLQRETQRLHRLIEDLLDLSRLRNQNQPLNRELRLIDALLTDVLALHSSRAEERQVTLQHRGEPDLPAVAVDPAQMMQVFNNLVGNAVAYTMRGGCVTVGARRELQNEQDGLAVFVHNDGPAIPSEELPHLFTRFFRGRNAQESGEPGTGLGLAIVQEIIERHAGLIRVESTPEAGTTFTVWLPLTTDGDPPGE
jgi:GAF domain-containing protein